MSPCPSSRRQRSQRRDESRLHVAAVTAPILDGAYYTSFLGDDVVAKGFVSQVVQPSVMDAMIHRLAGFDLHETVILPENGEKLVGFAAHPSGLAVAMRYLVPAAEYDEAGAVTDPETGLTFGYLRYTHTQSNRVSVTVECIYGDKTALADGIKRIVKPASSFTGLLFALFCISGSRC